jgi:hypothetical protein
MNRLRLAMNMVLTVLAVVVVCTAVIAGCFSTPKDGADYNHCNLSGMYFSYTPSYPITCGGTINPYCGCNSNVQDRVYYWKSYDAADCTGTELDHGGPVPSGTCHRDTAYLCWTE